MTHLSPAAFTVWSVLSTLMCGFFIGHLWRFDRFKCLRWSSGPYTGAFKRFMTYTYMLTLPLLMAYSYGFTYIKYMEGYTDVPHLGIVPTPYDLWPEKYRRAVFPLNLLFSFAWSLEMITHLEELCFWLFLVTAGPSQIYWFKSVYFRIWVAGSIAALVYMPVVTIMSRANPLQSEANTFLAGSLGDLVLTIAFAPILWSFPAFLDKVKREGVNGEAMVRLRTFYEMNVIRIIFRSIFVGSVLALGIDGVRGHVHRLNEIPFWTDFFVIAGAVGCAVSSALTVLIFFPRSFGGEYEMYQASNQLASQPSKSRRGPRTGSFRHSTARPRANSSSTIIGKTASPRLENQRYVQGNIARVDVPLEQDEENDMSKFARSPTKEHGTSNSYLLTNSPVHRLQFLPRESCDTIPPIPPIQVSNARLELEADITASSPHLDGSWTGIPTTENPNESEHNRWTPSPAQRIWRVHNRIPGVDELDKTTTTELSRMPGNRSFASIDSTQSCKYGGLQSPDSTRGMPLPEVNYAYLHSTPQLYEYSGNGGQGSSRRPGRTGKGVSNRLTHENLQWHNAHSSKFNPLVYTFTSPIDLMKEPEPFIARRPSYHDAV